MKLAFPRATKAVAVAASLTATDMAAASMPQQMWQGVRRVAVTCTLDAPRQFAPLRKSLCARFAAEAARRSPYPVVALDDAADADSLHDVTLNIDAFISPVGEGGQALLTFAVRPLRDDIRGESGSASRGAPVSVAIDSRGHGVQLENKIAATLNRILPWRREFRRAPAPAGKIRNRI